MHKYDILVYNESHAERQAARGWSFDPIDGIAGPAGLFPLSHGGRAVRGGRRPCGSFRRDKCAAGSRARLCRAIASRDDMIDPKARRLLERWIYILVKVESDFIVPYTMAMRDRIASRGAYGEEFMPFLDRFMDTLQEKRWKPGSYYPGGWYRANASAGREPEKAGITPRALARYYQEEFRIEADGVWRVGEKQVEGGVQAFFLEHLEFDGDLGRYRVRYWLDSYYETRYIHHASPPYRVRQVTSDGGQARLLLNDGRTEPLRPDSLRLDGAERLYCAVKAQGLPAVFENNARWQLLQQVEDREGRWVLCTEQGEIGLRLDDPPEFPGGIAPPDC